MSVSNISMQVRLLNAFLSGSWNDIFANFITVLDHQIVTVNHTQVTLVTMEVW